MKLGGYSGIPDTLPETQAMIVRLLNQIKASSRVAGYKMRVLQIAVDMVTRAKVSQ